MDLTRYQLEASRTAIFPDTIALAYCTMGLAGEAGEIANKVKKVYRDDGGKVTPEKRRELGDEIGDCLWYLSQLAEMLDLDLGYLAGENLAKLADRAARGVLGGSGDKR